MKRVSSPSRYRSPKSKKLYFSGRGTSYIAYALNNPELSLGSKSVNSSCKGGTIDVFLLPNLLTAFLFGDFDGMLDIVLALMVGSFVLVTGVSTFGHL